MARSPEPAAWVPGHKPVHGLLTHSSAGGLFPNMLKRAGLRPGRHRRPGRPPRAPRGRRGRPAHRRRRGRPLRDRRTGAASPGAPRRSPTPSPPAIKGGSTLTVGPAGWNLVDFACLTADYHRNFGRGGAGAVFGSKNLVAVTAYGRDAHRLRRRRGVQAASARRSTSWSRPASTTRPGRPRSARRPARPGGSTAPSTAATWASRAATCPGTTSTRAPSTPPTTRRCRPTPSWPSPASTASATSAGTSSAPARPRSPSGPYAGDGVRPEFETIALWINCCLLDRDAIFHLNHLCNELGVDTMTFGSVMAGAMELAEKGFLAPFGGGRRSSATPPGWSRR